MKKILIIILVFFLTALAVVLIFSYWLIQRAPVLEPKEWGITFSAFYAEEFGFDFKEVYLAMLDELGARKLRIPAYWNEIEKKEGIYDFSRLDWQIKEAEKRGAEVILAVGRKLPRWPECHEPEWVQNQESRIKNQKLLEYIEKTVNRYKNNRTVKIWQIENEPFLPFGDCPTVAADFLDKEIELVRSLDSRSIITTDSGELSLWIPTAKRADIFGSSIYRRVRTKWLGAVTYPLPPEFFRLKRALTEFFVGKKPMIIIELQAEPWLGKALREASIEEQLKAMGPEGLDGILSYASRSGFDTFYLWGAEWWYWMKTQGHPEIWEIAKEAIKDTNILINTNDTNDYK